MCYEISDEWKSWRENSWENRRNEDISESEEKMARAAGGK